MTAKPTPHPLAALNAQLASHMEAMRAVVGTVAQLNAGLRELEERVGRLESRRARKKVKVVP